MQSEHKKYSLEHWAKKIQHGGTLLTVNQRLSRHYHVRYQNWRVACEDTCWETPNILPVSAWLRQMHSLALMKGLSSKVILHDLAQIQLWQQCIESDLSQYKGSDAIVALLNLESAAKEAAKAWSIEKQWCLAIDDDQPLSIDQRAYQRWRKRYVAVCSENHWIDSASVGEHVLGLISQHGGELDLPASIQIAGFLQIPALTRSLLDAFQNQSVEVTELPMVNASIEDAARLQIFSNEATEITYVAARCRSLLERRSDTRIGIVVPDLTSRRLSVVRALDAEFFPGLNPREIATRGRPYDISLGVPLVELPAVRAALLSLAFYDSTIDTVELSQWLLSPYLVGAETYLGQRTRLDRELRREPLNRVRLAEFAKANKLDSELAKAIHKVQRVKLDSSQTLSAHAKLFSAVLEALGWPGKSLDSEEFQSVAAWRAVLEDAEHLDTGAKLSRTQALRWLTQLCVERVFQPESADVPIQVVGRLESHGLEFDSLMVVGLDSDNWPPTLATTAFLPFALQKSVGVPEASKELQLEIAKTELDAWCGAATDVRLSVVDTRDGQELTRTELLNKIALLEPEPEIPTSLSAAETIQAFSASALKATSDTHGPEIQDDERAKGGARLFEDQAQCPFRAFALHRLSIRPMEEATLGLDPRAHGNLLHYALEYFWTDVKNHDTLKGLDDEKLKDLLVVCIDRSLDENKVAETYRDLERTRLLLLLFDWLKENEGSRDSFEVEKLEAEHDVSYQGFQLRLKIDRIDRLPSGKRIILDYKTGINNKRNGWAQQRIENPQLPLYALVTDEVDGVAFAQVAHNARAFLGIASEEGLLKGVVSKIKLGDVDITDWESWLEHWRESLDILADELKQGLATVTPTKQACQFCELPSLCRIADVGDDGLSVGVNEWSDSPAGVDSND